MPANPAFIARQPILDRRSAVVAYELLFRSGPENRFQAADVELASSQSVELALMTFGLEQLTAGKTAFMNVTRSVLIGELYTLLPPDRCVIELLETVEPDAEVVAACQRLKSQGYRLALDDFSYQTSFEPLLDLTDILKIDFRSDEAGRTETLKRLGKRRPTLLAEKVETHEERQRAEGLGFEMFQGYFFCKPEMVRNTALAPSKLNYLRLLREVGQDDIDPVRIEEVIRQEIAFSTRLLRYLNSVGFGWQYQIDTIAHAVRVLGARQLRKWVSAVATVGLGDGKPNELVATALRRARLAELLAVAVGLDDANLELFLSGLLSLMDAMLDQPLEVILGAMALSEDVRAGILQRSPPFGPVLDLVVAQERADWGAVEQLSDRLGTSPPEVQEAYREAGSWATALASAA